MRIYFLSSRKAILKLNGLYAGGVDAFERHIDMDLNDGILAEITPGDNFGGLNFFIDDSLFSSPPPFLDCYLLGNEALIYARTFMPADRGLNVIYQARFSGNLMTVFDLGERYLAIDGEKYNLYKLKGRGKVQANERSLAGYPVIEIISGGETNIISHTGERIFAGEGVEAYFGERLTVRESFATCARVCAESTYSYDGEKLTLLNCTAKEGAPVGEKIMHFAFFESVLHGADFEKYLSPDLIPRAGEIREYLGHFTGVSVPTESFCLAHPDMAAAGLIYPKKFNLFEVKYFFVETKDGKIDNIAPVE